jgi:hypothetical protein
MYSQYINWLNGIVMQITFIVTQVLHVLSGVFWAGSTFALARTGAAHAEQLFRPQLGAAAVAVVTGGLLWQFLHPASFGTQEQVLALGALCAVTAAGVQSVMCGSALRQFSSAGDVNAAPLQARIAISQRIAAGLLMLTVICMAASRYL